MADYSPTASSVAPGSGSAFQDGTAGATATAGKVAYQDSSDDKFKLADCTTSSATATVVGFFLNGVSDGQPTRIHTKGPLTFDAIFTAGAVVVLSTSGNMCPVADLLSNDYVCTLGVATSTTVLDVQIHNSGVQVP